MKRALFASMFLIALSLAGCNAEQVAEYKQRIGLLNEQAKTLQEQIDDRVAEVEAVVTAANAELDKAREQAEALPEGPDRDQVLAFIGKVEQERDRALTDGRKFIERGEEELAKIVASADSLNKQLEEVETGLGAAGATAQAVSRHLPPPYDLILTGIGGLLLAGDQARRRRRQQKRADDSEAQAESRGRALQSTVEAIEIAKREGEGKIDFSDRSVRDRMRGAMSSEAREAVDTARKVMADKAPVIK